MAFEIASAIGLGVLVVLLLRYVCGKYRCCLAALCDVKPGMLSSAWQRVQVPIEFDLRQFESSVSKGIQNCRIASGIDMRTGSGFAGTTLSVTKAPDSTLRIRPKYLLRFHPFLFVVLGTIIVRPVLGVIWLLFGVFVTWQDETGESTFIAALARKEGG